MIEKILILLFTLTFYNQVSEAQSLPVIPVKVPTKPPPPPPKKASPKIAPKPVVAKKPKVIEVDTLFSAEEIMQKEADALAKEEERQRKELLRQEKLEADRIKKEEEQQRKEDERKEKEEAERLKREEQLFSQNMYDSLTRVGDELLVSNSFDEASSSYTHALDYKPKDLILTQKLELVEKKRKEAEENRIKEENLSRIRYRDSLTNLGTINYAMEKFYESRDFYSQASDIFPDSLDYAKTQLVHLNHKINEIENILAKQELERKYPLLIKTADSALLLKDFETALNAATEAEKIKPEELRPKRILQQINDPEERKRIIYNADRLESNIIVDNAEKTFKENNFEETIMLLNKAKALWPQNNRIEYILLKSKKALGIYDSANHPSRAEIEVKWEPNSGFRKKAPEEANQNISSVVGVKPEINATAANPGLTMVPFDESKVGQIPYIPQGLKVQEINVPYSPDELAFKFPGIDFNTLPRGQKLNSICSTENDTIIFGANINKLRNATPLFSVNDAYDSITVLMDYFTMIDDAIYLRLWIGNNSSKDFVTGSMGLAFQGVDGNLLPLDACYISGFPVVMPSQQAAVYYVVKTKAPDKSDNIIFTLTERISNARYKLGLSGKELYGVR